MESQLSLLHTNLDKQKKKAKWICLLSHSFTVSVLSFEDYEVAVEITGS